MNRVFLLIIALTVCLASVCTIVRDNPLDEKGTSFIEPSVEIDTTLSSIVSGDTIHVDSGTISVTGTRPECRLRWKLSDGAWTDWTSGAEGIIHFDSLADGEHSVTVATKYPGGEQPTEQNIVFLVQTAGYKPFFTLTNDTNFAVEAGDSITLFPAAGGAGTHTSTWQKNDTTLEGAVDDSLVIVADNSTVAGSYRCIVTSEYGTAASGRFVVTVRSPAVFRVHYYPNGADDGSAPVDDKRYRPGESIDIAANIGELIKTDYSFAGWNESPDDGGVHHTVGSSITMDSADITLYAWWTKNPVYSITYHDNGARAGTVPTDNNHYVAGSAVTVQRNMGGLEKDDRIFDGWSRQPDAGAIRYSPGDTVIVGTEDLALYVVWSTLPLYHIAYLPNGAQTGTVPVDDSGYFTGASLTLPGNSGSLVYPGSTFVGWCTTAGGDGKKFGAGDTLIIGQSTVKLYARWSALPTFAVKYDGNDAAAGTVPTDENNYETGSIATVKGNTGNLTRPGATFIGWDVNAGAISAAFKPGADLTIGSGTVTLYAIWTTNPTYGVSYYGNGNTAGEPPVDESNYEEGAAVTVRGKGTLVKTGHTFIGWNTVDDGSGRTCKPDSTFRTDTGDIVLYAQWQINRYTVTFFSQGGSSVESQTADSGSLLLTPAEPIRTEYRFAGWYKEAGGINLWNFAADKLTGIDTLFAKWTLMSYHITFDTRGGDVIAAASVNYGSIVPSPVPAPRRTGCDFDGWYRDASCTVAWNFQTDTIFTDDTMFAGWTRRMCRVIFDTRGGSAVAPATVYYGATIAIPDPAPGWNGYAFGGWYRDSSYATAWNFMNDTVIADDTLFAKWTVAVWLVTFNTRCATTLPPRTVNHGDTISVPAGPARSGYTLDGWYSDSMLTDDWVFASDRVIAALTLYAKWVVADKPYEIGTWSNFCQAAVSHTFDDNMNESGPGLDIFTAKNFHVTLFTITGTMSPNWENLRTAFAAGHEVGSHSVSHTSSIVELNASQQAIKTNVPGERCAVIAYPNCNSPGDAQVLQYYIAGRNCSGLITDSSPSNLAQISSKMFGSCSGCPNDAASMNSFADLAAAGNGWAVYCHHGVGSETHSWAVTSLPALSAHLDYLDTSRSRIWVENFGNVARYIRERKAAAVNTVTSTDSRITLRVTDNLVDSIFNYPLSIQRELPGDWNGSLVTQNGIPAFDTIVVVNAQRYIMFKAVPDGGDVVIVKE